VLFFSADALGNNHRIVNHADIDCTDDTMSSKVTMVLSWAFIIQIVKNTSESDK